MAMCWEDIHVGTRIGSSLAIVLVRVLLLALASGAVIAAFVMTRRAEHHLSDARLRYVCPMHPEVTAATPGDCPICRMQLELRATTSAASAAAGPSPADDDPAPASFLLPPGAEIRHFEELGYGKMYEMSREMRGPAWADSTQVGQALFYRDEIALLDAEEGALFIPSTRLRDGKPAGIAVRRIDEPPAAWDSGTALVRFRVQGKGQLTPNQTGWVKFATRVRQVRAVRSSAVIQSAGGPYVLLVGKDRRTFTKRPIQIGSALYDHAGVLAGLEVGERIATLNTFSLDAERRFSGRTSP